MRFVHKSSQPYAHTHIERHHGSTDQQPHLSLNSLLNIMELPYYSLCTTIILLILFSLFSFLNYRSKKHRVFSKLPPGPKPLPIIGNLHNLIGGKLPHHTLRDLSRKYGPLMHLKLGEVSTLIVSSPNMAREFMKTHDISFAQRPELFAIQVSKYGNCNIAFAPYGEYLRQMKKVCVIELLSNKRVQSFSSLPNEEIQKLIEKIRSSSPSPINLTQSFLEMTSTIICRAAFGSRYDSQDALTSISAIKEAIILAGGFNLADFYPSKKLLKVISPMRAKVEKVVKIIDDALVNIINEHMPDSETMGSSGNGEQEIEDLVDVLLRVQKSGSLEIPITTNHIKAVISDMFGAGTETVATTMEWAMAEMMKNPSVMEKAQAEIRQVVNGKATVHEEDIQAMNYLKLVIKETLRLHPPSPLLLPRECREPCVINGFEIPLKTRVFINAWAIGRDPMSWGKDAESFNPERFIDSSVDYKGKNFEYIPFGAGRRICPGMSFGLANLELALSQLLYHFDWNLPTGMKPENLDMSEVFGTSVGRKHDLYLTAVPFMPVEA